MCWLGYKTREYTGVARSRKYVTKVKTTQFALGDEIRERFATVDRNNLDGREAGVCKLQWDSRLATAHGIYRMNRNLPTYASHAKHTRSGCACAIVHKRKHIEHTYFKYTEFVLRIVAQMQYEERTRSLSGLQANSLTVDSALFFVWQLGTGKQIFRIESNIEQRCYMHSCRILVYPDIHDEHIFGSNRIPYQL